MITNEFDVKAHCDDDLYQNYIKIFLINSEEKISKMGFDMNQKPYQNTSNIVDIVGSMKTILLIALRLNKFQFDSKMNQA